MPKVTMSFQKCFDDYKFSISKIIVEVSGTDELVNAFYDVLEGMRNGEATIRAYPVRVQKEESETEFSLRFFYFDR